MPKNLRHLPHFSENPWAGFTSKDKPRTKPLPCCPRATCRRARQCQAAVDGLYCLRTHMRVHEAEKRNPDVAALAFEATLPQDRFPRDFHMAAERTTRRLEFYGQRNADKNARWQAGDFAELYGAWSKRGKWMEPPPRVYVDER